MYTRLHRAAFITAFVILAGLPLAARQAAVGAPAQASAPKPVNLQQALPFDAAVKTGTLPNGLTYYVRKNSRPANRVVLRLAVKTGSLDMSWYFTPSLEKYCAPALLVPVACPPPKSVTRTLY